MNRFLTNCLMALGGFFTVAIIIILSKYLFGLVVDGEVDTPSEKFLTHLLDWSTKIFIGFLAKSLWDKKVLSQ